MWASPAISRSRAIRWRWNHGRRSLLSVDGRLVNHQVDNVDRCHDHLRRQRRRPSAGRLRWRWQDRRRGVSPFDGHLVSGHRCDTRLRRRRRYSGARRLQRRREDLHRDIPAVDRCVVSLTGGSSPSAGLATSQWQVTTMETVRPNCNLPPVEQPMVHRDGCVVHVGRRGRRSSARRLRRRRRDRSGDLPFGDRPVVCDQLEYLHRPCGHFRRLRGHPISQAPVA